MATHYEPCTLWYIAWNKIPGREPESFGPFSSRQEAAAAVRQMEQDHERPFGPHRIISRQGHREVRS